MTKNHANNGTLVLEWRKPDGTTQGVDLPNDFPVAGTYDQQQEWMASAWNRLFKVVVMNLFGEEMHAAWKMHNDAMMKQLGLLPEPLA